MPRHCSLDVLGATFEFPNVRLELTVCAPPVYSNHSKNIDLP